MTTRTVTPLSQLDRHVPEAGRIRMGHQVAVAGTNKRGEQKSRPAALNAFRFTSPTKDLLDQLAVVYGGDVKPWNDKKASPSEQWQLYSNADDINVLCIPGSLSVWYEHWEGKGCLRRCDGVTCKVPQQTGPHDYELVDVDCLCRAEGIALCARHTRIQFILPEISFAGCWRLESHGTKASHELPAMADLIEALTVQGRMVKARLSIDHRSEMTIVGPRNYIVPKLSMEDTPLALAAGGSTLAIGAGDTPAPPPTMQLGAGSLPLQRPEADDIVDAEEVTDEMLAIEAALRADARNFGLPPDAYLDAVKAECQHWHDVKGGDDVYTRMAACSTAVRAMKIEPQGFKRGRVDWKTL